MGLAPNAQTDGDGKPTARSTLRKLGYGLFTAGAALLFVELLAHRTLGDPPELDAVRRVALCSLREEGGRAWMECATTERDLFAVPTAKGARPRVAVLGGSSVRDPFKPTPGDDFPDHLQRRLPEVEVLNVGKAGMSMSGVAWLAGQLEALEPDLVVLYEGHNDYAQTVFRGAIRGARPWLLPVQRILSASWIYAWLAGTELGSDPTPAPRKPGVPGALDPHRPPLCDTVLASPSARRGVLVVQDDTALRVRDQVTARYRDDLRTAIRSSPAPVVVSTLLRNFDYPPQGVLAEDDGACTMALPCLTHEALGDWDARATYSARVCGEDAAVTLWLRAHALAEAGKTAEATETWRRSLAADPVPLRAPYEADVLVRQAAAEEGARLLDLEPIAGAMPPGRLFTDTLHPSTEGAALIAATLEPVVREALGLPAGAASAGVPTASPTGAPASP